MRYFQRKECLLEAVLSEHMEKYFDTHNHVGHYVISFLLAGKAKVWQEGQEKVYCEGEAFLAVPYAPHAVYQYLDTRILSLCIGIPFVEKYSMTKAEEILKEFLEKLRTVDFEINPVREGKILEAVKEVYRLHEKGQSEPDAEMADLTQKIIVCADGKLPVKNMGKAVYMSSYYLIRKFKSKVGMTPHQFQIQNRVRKAQHLLNSGKSIAWVSAEAGFYDQSHLNKCFNKIVGISPAEYKNSRIEIE